MAFELVPFPISILFVVVFGLAWIVVLYKLRRRGRIHSVLFKANLIIGILALLLFLLSIVAGMLG